MRRRRPERGRGRRVLAWAAMGFVAATVAAGALIDAAPLDVRFPELDRALRGVDRAKGRLAVVFHGSSRFQAGIRPEVIEPTLRRATGDASLRVVSGAVAAGDPISGELFVREMIARGHRPTILVQEISPETVSSSPFMSFHLARQFTWADIATALPDIYRSQTSSRLLSSRLLPVYRHGPQFRNWLLPEADVVPPDGTNAAEPAAFVPCQPRPPDRSGAMEARVVRTWRKHYKPGGKGARELERLLGRSRAVGITTILVGVPVTSPHRAYYTRDVEEWFVAYMDRLAREYGSRYVDYRDRIPDECFIDHHHMSDAGGLRFSRMLAEEVLVPTLQTGPRPAGR